MLGEEANSNHKLDDLLSKMDVLLQGKTEMLTKLNTLEQTQAIVVKDLNELKNYLKDTDLRILELNSDLALRPKETEVDSLVMKVDDLENCWKCSNIIIWGVKLESEKSFNSMVEFLEIELLKNYIRLDDGIEIMREHRTNVKKKTASPSLLQYTFIY